MTHSALLEVATRAAVDAGALAQGRRPRTVTDKGERDLTTDSDVAAEALIRHILHLRIPTSRPLGKSAAEKHSNEDCSGL